MKAGEALTATCVTASTSASAEPLNCRGLWMTSSFLETLLALPCIINNYETPFKLDPKQEWTVNISGEGKSREKFGEGCSLSPAFSERSDCVESEGRTPSLRRSPLLHSVVLLGGVKHPHTHTQWSNLTPHYPPAWWHRADKGKQMMNIPPVLQSGRGRHALCRQLKQERPWASSKGTN